MNSFFSRQGAAFRNDLNRAAGALIGIAQGFLCDGHLNDNEIRFLLDWLEKNESVACSWPGDVIYARVREIFSDGQVTEAERAYLTEMLQKLIGGGSDELAEASHVSELALDRSASVHIPASTFCLTGDFVFATRSHCKETIVGRGGLVSRSVTKRVKYVVVGGLGSTEWTHGSYGTKIEKAIEYKRSGVPLLIVHEDQWAAAL